jgi:hypothetical protein
MQVIEKGAKIRVIRDSEWELMLPEERKAALVDRYIAKRAQFVAAEKKAESEQKHGRLKQWLESPAVRVVTMIPSMVQIAELVHQHGWALLHHFGLAFLEEVEVDQIGRESKSDPPPT